jgi:CRISPR/Cas system-associated protein Cas10 (large subunit of type III CRISPR-Cas system)
MRSSRSYEAILGGLLHDVGKVFQRECASEKILGEITRRMESTLCPGYQGRYSP